MNMLWKMIDTSKDFEWEKTMVLLWYLDLWDKVARSHKGASEIRLVLKGMSRGEERELTHVKKKKNCKCFTQSLIYYLIHYGFYSPYPSTRHSLFYPFIHTGLFSFFSTIMTRIWIRCSLAGTARAVPTLCTVWSRSMTHIFLHFFM